MVTALAEAPPLDALIEALDPEVRAAIDDVDRTLIALALQQSPWERLRSAPAPAIAAGVDAIAKRSRSPRCSVPPQAR